MAKKFVWGCSTAHMGLLNSTHGGAQQYTWGCSTAHMGVLNSTHGGAQQHTWGCSTAHMGVLNSTQKRVNYFDQGFKCFYEIFGLRLTTVCFHKIWSKV